MTLILPLQFSTQNAPMSDRRFWFSTVLVLVAAFGLRVGTAVWWQGRLDRAGERFAMGDSDGYWVLAATIAAGAPYQYGSPHAAVFRAPGYPLLLSLVVDPTDPDRRVLAARIVGCALGTAAVALLMAITGWFFSRHAALLAGGIAAVYPGGITMSVLVLSEAPFIPLMLLVLVALAALLREEDHERRGAWLAAVAGCLSGIAVLVRPSWLLFLPFYFAVRIAMGENRRRELRLALIAGAALAATMSPWWIRNYRVTGKFVPTTLQVGASLYDGLHPGATGGSDMRFVEGFTRQVLEEELDDASSEPLEYRLNRRMAAAAISWAGEHPVEVLRLAGRKIARTWWPWPSAEEVPGGALGRWAFACGAIAIFLPAAVFTVRHRVWRTALFPMIVPAVYFTLLHAVFVGSIRYRQPALVALVVLAAPQYVDWWRRISHRPIKAYRGGNTAPDAES